MSCCILWRYSINILSSSPPPLLPSSPPPLLPSSPPPLLSSSPPSLLPSSPPLLLPSSPPPLLPSFPPPLPPPFTRFVARHHAKNISNCLTSNVKFNCTEKMLLLQLTLLNDKMKRE